MSTETLHFEIKLRRSDLEHFTFDDLIDHAQKMVAYHLVVKAGEYDECGDVEFHNLTGIDLPSGTPPNVFYLVRGTLEVNNKTPDLL